MKNKMLVTALTLFLMIGMTSQAMAALEDWYHPDDAKHEVIDLTKNRIEVLEDRVIYYKNGVIDKIVHTGSGEGGNSTDIHDTSDRNNVVVYLNDKFVIFPDQQPYINEDNRTLVPVRFMAQDLGCDVEWIDNEQKVIMKQTGTEIQLIIGENKATVNGETVTFDTEAIIKNDRTMVPLRFISETFNARVDYLEEKRSVIIYTR